jgi:hypothetical protein
VKKLIKYLTSLSLVILLFPMSAISGEIIEAECSADGNSALFLIDTDGGKQVIAGSEADVRFTKNKVILTAEKSQVIIDFESGQLFIDSEKTADCKFSNLEALGMESTVNADADAEVKVTEPQESKAYETICGLETYFDDMIIVPSRISGPFSLDDFGDDGNIGIEALVDGNGNQARFSGIIEYEKVGNRLELDGDEIETTVTKEQFQEHFGLFPTVTCNAG